MKKLLHIVINDESLLAEGNQSLFSFLERLNLNFIQIKNYRQFNCLIEYLPNDVEVFIWVHPNAEVKKETNLGTTGEASALALKERGIEFELLSRYPNDIDPDFLKQIGKTPINVTSISRFIGDHSPNRIEKLNGTSPTIRKTIVANDVKVAIISALYDDEFTALKDFVENIECVDGFETLKLATLKDSQKKVLIDFQSRMGMVDSATLSTQIINRFPIEYLIMVGVCGGRAKKGAKLLDLVIPDKVFDYQSGKYEQGIFKPYLRASNLNIKFIQAVKDEIQTKMIEHCPSPLKKKLQKIGFQFGSLACGNVVVKTDGFLEGEIAKYDEQVIGVEMESYGVTRATELANLSRIKPIIIKSVMDYTESGKNDIDKANAAYFSACFTYFLIKDYL